jgi:glutathione S-transferase
VLELDGEVVAGSARILDALERRFPEPPLLPRAPALRERALRIQAEFDAEVGPAVRTAIFSVLIREPGYLCRVFASGQPPLLRGLYRASFPLARGAIARANGTTDPRGVERAFERARRALDFVEEEAGPAGGLAGDAFSLADLCCAALLAPLVSPDHPDMALPHPMPDAVEAFLARWRGHPGAAWVRDCYARYRPRRAAIA